MMRALCAVVLAFTSLAGSALPQPRDAGSAYRTRNVVLITLDGVRLEEMFGGLDADVLRSVTRDGAIENTSTYTKYWAATPAERRRKVMPFFWGTLMARHGSIAGNQARGSIARITNTHRFSYPGYSEILVGEAHDQEIASNDKIRNPFPTVLEFLRERLRVDARKVAAFASWDTFNWIAEHQEGAITVNAGLEIYEHPDPAVRMLSKVQAEAVPEWDGVRHDAFTFRLAMAHLQTHTPRALYIAFDETDDWAHDRRYGQVLETLERTDAFLRQLWEFLQRHDQYRDRTTLIVTTDHGRGRTPTDWSNHGKDVEGAQDIWIAIVSPDDARRAEWENAPTIYQNQIAATLAHVMGFDYVTARPGAGKPINLKQ